MEPIKILKETKLPSEFWNRAYEMGLLIFGDDLSEVAKYGISIDDMRMRADDRSCLCHEGLIFFIKEGSQVGEWITTKHILRITEESGVDTFTVEIFEDHNDSDLLFQEFGVSRDKLRETVFREAGKIRDMFFAV